MIVRWWAQRGLCLHAWDKRQLKRGLLLTVDKGREGCGPFFFTVGDFVLDVVTMAGERKRATARKGVSRCDGWYVATTGGNIRRDEYTATEQ